jgi:plasmid maintenance system antidote protein VapI
MTRPRRSAPHERTDDWPERPSPDHSGEVARLFALRLRAAMDGMTLRAAAEKTGVDHSTISGILHGRAWPDLDTVARLERGFGVALWPGPIDL